MHAAARVAHTLPVVALCCRAQPNASQNVKLVHCFLFAAAPFVSAAVVSVAVDSSPCPTSLSPAASHSGAKRLLREGGSGRAVAAGLAAALCVLGAASLLREWTAPSVQLYSSDDLSVGAQLRAIACCCRPQFAVVSVVSVVVDAGDVYALRVRWRRAYLTVRCM
jgi:hypothetical protein